MGSKKKKRGGGGRKNKGRASSKDPASPAGYDADILSEELTALGAIFQEDFKIVSDLPPQFIIKLRPYSKGTESEDPDVSALLSVRCLPGYPYKCPKLQITAEKGLSENDANNLLSLLHDQANFNAREGRVMIFNLVEAAQEFLSEVVPVGQSDKSVPCPGMDGSDNQLHEDVKIAYERTSSATEPFVYGLVDLFSSLEESFDWGLGTDRSRVRNYSTHVHTLDTSKVGYRVSEQQLVHNAKPSTPQDAKQVPTPWPSAKLDALEEESEDEDKVILNDSSIPSVEKPLRNHITHEDQEAHEFYEKKNVKEDDDTFLEIEPSDSLSSTSITHDQASHTIKRDLLMVHLLRLACASKGSLADALPGIASELYNLGILSEQMRDLSTKPSLLFSRAFEHVFQQHMVSSSIPQFWKSTLDFGGQNTSSLLSSRYLNDFEELCAIGHGGFGHVVLCKNKLDGRQYAVKKIRLKDRSLPVNNRILREVATLSRLQHQHVVRYYQAWIETQVGGFYGDSTFGSRTGETSSCSYNGANSTNALGPENRLESTFLYIQMEYCPRTLRQKFESYNDFEKESAWHLFRQIVEGLAHIHAQGIIHRDLTPNNIFFDARNDIKIGDFGLAKFLKMEQVDYDPHFPPDTTGISIDGTGQVGTYFYTAPEIEQGWPKIDEKVDMYSLGVVFFELWHPFGTAMERHIVLSELKQKGELPPDWVVEFPEQASLLRCLMSPSPSDRPSATELLQKALPPRMEYEWLNDILQRMQTSEDTRVYDMVVNAIFNEERIIMKTQRQHGGRVKLARDQSSFIQYTEINTELRDHVNEVAKEIFRQHCAKRLEITPMCIVDDYQQFYRDAVKLLTPGGDILALCHELRLPFVNWVIENQMSSFKRYEISWVYRKAIGHSTPNRYLQGDFDVIGGASISTEAEVIKVAMDIITRFFYPDSCDIRLNHGHLLDAMWTWIGIEVKLRRSVAELLSTMGSLRPQSSERKSRWVFIRRQLLQDLNLTETVVNRLQTVGLRLCGPADQALPRLRGALPPDKPICKALEELSALCGYLRVWGIERRVFLDALMPPTENYHRDIFFQIYLNKENNTGSVTEGALLAIGGRYDHLLHPMWDHEYKSNPPGAVGTSLALEKIVQHSLVEIRPSRNESGTDFLICSRGSGGLLKERMELAAELWQANINAQFVPMQDPSLTEQYEYANEHDIKCLIIITNTSLSPTDSVKVRHLELKKEKEVERGDLVKFLTEAVATQFRNLSIRN